MREMGIQRTNIIILEKEEIIAQQTADYDYGRGPSRGQNYWMLFLLLLSADADSVAAVMGQCTFLCD